ncbi:MAG: class I SAM-dependent methyltransferase [Magnetococcales bacterium]|nr:class I SAM-dependent methyltransferase [Magnetococcales bacterium]
MIACSVQVLNPSFSFEFNLYSMDDSSTHHYYENPQTARHFEESRFYGAFGAWLKERDWDFFTRHPHINYSKLNQILELGCGTGRITRSLLEAAPSANLLAVDRSQEMLSQLQQHLPPAHQQRLTIQCSSVESLNLSHRSFDLVCFSRLLMHLPDWSSFLTQACSLSNQWILCDFPVQGSPAWLGKTLLNHFSPPKGDGGYHFLPLPKVVNLLENNGFEIIDLHRLLLLPIPLHLRLGSPNLSLTLEKWLGGALLRRKIGSPVYLLAKKM